MSFTLRVDTGGIEAMFDGLSEEAQAAARPAAQAAADVLYKVAKANAARIAPKTGRLAASIYQAFSQDGSGPGVATYHVSWRTQRSGGLSRAPHAHLIENGHWQYYVTYRNKAGQLRTAIRPEMRGKPPPKGKQGSPEMRARMDAYYVPLPDGPRWIAAQPFMRPAWAAAETAARFGRDEFFARLRAYTT